MRLSLWPVGLEGSVLGLETQESCEVNEFLD